MVKPDTGWMVLPGSSTDHDLAEADGNRTRRCGIATANCFEGSGVHQVPGHLHLVSITDGRQPAGVGVNVLWTLDQFRAT